MTGNKVPRIADSTFQCSDDVRSAGFFVKVKLRTAAYLLRNPDVIERV